MMVRKKSGELVRPSLKADGSRRDYSKPRSAPATPVCPKYVHFDTQLEHVKHFIAQQRPAAVSRTGSPIETETEEEPEAYPFPAMVQPKAGTVKLVLPNFPTATVRAAADKDAYVDSLEMDKDGRNIKGIVRVKNLAFEKWVAIRFTLDHWRTVSEVSAEYLDSPPSKAGAQDRFTFTIKLQDLLSRIEDKTMFLAVRYTVGGREIWDNNDGQNYRIEFRKVPASTASGNSAAAVAARAMAARSGAGAPNGSAAAQRRAAWSVTSAGQAADRMADLRRELDRLVSDDAFDDDEIPSDGSDSRRQAAAAAAAAAAAGGVSGMHIGGVSGNGNGGASSRTARFGLGMDLRSYSDTSATAPVTLSGRYDFGNSLKMYAAPVPPNGSAGGASSGMKPRTQASPRFATGTLNDAVSHSLVLVVSLVALLLLTARDTYCCRLRRAHSSILSLLHPSDRARRRSPYAFRRRKPARQATRPRSSEVNQLQSYRRRPKLLALSCNRTLARRGLDRTARSAGSKSSRRLDSPRPISRPRRPSRPSTITARRRAGSCRFRTLRPTAPGKAANACGSTRRRASWITGMPELDRPSSRHVAEPIPRWSRPTSVSNMASSYTLIICRRLRRPMTRPLLRRRCTLVASCAVRRLRFPSRPSTPLAVA